jgi:hypothetical protein
VLPPGNQTQSLLIEKNGVVLRGEGNASTRIFNDAPSMTSKSVVRVRNAGAAMNWYQATGPLLTADAQIGDTVLSVNSTSGVTVGSLMCVRGNLTAAFVNEIGNVYGNGTAYEGWRDPGGNYGNRMMAFSRRIVDKTATTLTIDVPIRYPVKVRDGGRVVFMYQTPVKEVGIEHLAIGMREVTGADFSDTSYKIAGTGGNKTHYSHAIAIAGAEHCWVRNVSSYKPPQNQTAHLLSNGIRVDNSRFITIENCDLRHSQYKGDGGNGYLYALSGQETLVKDCYAEGGRHNLSFGLMQCSGNVIHRLTSKSSRNGCDFHQFLSPANLVDACTFDDDRLDAFSRVFPGTNPQPGQTTTESVIWNAMGINKYTSFNNSDSFRGAAIIYSKQQGNGYVIGTRGPYSAVYSLDHTEGVGQGDRLVPEALYPDQLAKRKQRLGL